MGEIVQFMKSRRGGEMVGIVILASGVILATAIATYHPADSSVFFTSSRSEIRNAAGFYGSTLAWIFVNFFGSASILFPIAFLLSGWNRFWGHEIEHFHTKFLGFISLSIAFPPLLDLAVGKVWFRESLILSGGYLGQELRAFLAARLHPFGTAVVLITGVLLGLLLITRVSLAAVISRIREVMMGAGRAFSFQIARHRERRRRERMKTTVVRKHLGKSGEFRIVPPPLHAEVQKAASESPRSDAPVVRQVKGHGSFQIRKVTKADLRKVREELTIDGPPDMLALYDSEERFETAFTSPDEIPPRASSVPEWSPDSPSAPMLRRLRVVEPVEEFEELPAELPLMRPRERNIPRPQRRLPDSRPSTKDGEGNLSTARLPYVNLLTPGPQQDVIDDEVHRTFLDVGKLIEERCREFSVEGEVTAYHPGPVVTTFEFKPSAGVKYAKVVNLGDDLALALKAESIRIERISGSSTVGIEVPNKKRELITLRDIIDTEQFTQSSSMLTLALGKDIHGDAFVTDLAKMPHLLVAGATGAGKSVGLNSMIVSLLYKALPRQLRMLMIDPKMVELKIYEDIPHLLHPIVTDPKLASNALLWAVQEMENRYKLLSECGVRNLDQYNVLLKDPEAHRRSLKLRPDQEYSTPDPLHYIVIIIDEFADLMMVASKDVEDSVTRLAQKARAVGIHLILATQRPSVDVITGVIKANFPSRISYQVASRIDSRTILDAQGAERLLGNGDMLFLPPGTARVRRIHGAYVSEKEIAEIVEFVKKNQGTPNFIEEITKPADEKGGADGLDYLDDVKYDEAVRVVLTTGQASASYLQRRLKLGYSRAARLIEIMEANGVVGPSQGSKPREILVRSDDYPPAAGSAI